MASSSACVLVQHPEAKQRHDVASQLEEGGFEVKAVASWREAEAAIADQEPSAVVLTLEEPLEEGIECLVAQHRAHSNLPIVVLSKEEHVKEGVRALRLGAWDYLCAPYTALTIEHVVCKMLERARLVSDNERYRAALEDMNQQLQTSLALLEEDQEAGRQVQGRLFPETPWTMKAYAVSHHMEPSLHLSGDYVDYRALDDRYMMAYIMDVSGHGASSAFITVLLKSLIDQKVAQNSPLLHEPERLLAWLSDELHAASLGKYATMVFACIDTQDHQVSYAFAGHYPQPMWYLPGHPPHYFEGRSFPVGIQSGNTYERYTQSMPPGSRLCLCSDGVLELFHDLDTAAKEKKLLEEGEQAQGNAAAFYTSLHHNHPSQAPLPDDVTLLCISHTDTKDTV